MWAYPQGFSGQRLFGRSLSAGKNLLFSKKRLAKVVVERNVRMKTGQVKHRANAVTTITLVRPDNLTQDGLEIIEGSLDDDGS
jgi:hypothetical protein